MGAHPAFVFEGDTFAVPSWEFRCELPPVHDGTAHPVPSTLTDLFGVTWTVYRGYEQGEPAGVVLVSPSGELVGLNRLGRGAAAMGVLTPRANVIIAVQASHKRALTPDEFMRALKEIAERVAD